MYSFPVPPVPKELKDSNRMFVPEERLELIKKYTLQAEDYVMKGDLDNGKLMYLKVVDLNPYDGIIWQALGHIYLIKEKLLEAYNWYQGCLFYLHSYTDPQLFFGIGRLYYKMKLFRCSILAFKLALDLKPPYILEFQIYSTLGMAHSKMYELETAIESFEKALSLNIGSPEQQVDILIKLGLLEEEKGDLVKAQLRYNSALKVGVSADKILLHIAWCYFKSKSYDRYERFFFDFSFFKLAL